MPASRHQDHATSPYATAPFVHAPEHVTTLPRPPHPAPNVRDGHETPLLGARDGRDYTGDLGPDQEVFAKIRSGSKGPGRGFATASPVPAIHALLASLATEASMPGIRPGITKPADNARFYWLDFE